MAADKEYRISRLRVKPGEDRKTIHAKAPRAFTVADLQRYTEIEGTVPMEQVLTEMETIHREETRKLKKQRR